MVSIIGEESSPDWLTNDFLQDVLREHFKDNNLEIDKVAIKQISMHNNDNDNDNDDNEKDENGNGIGGLGSVLYRATFYMKNPEEAENHSFSVIAKVHPKGLNGMTAHKRKLFQREIYAYKEILPRMEELLLNIGDQTKIAPTCYYTTETPEPFLILEDMSLNDFRNYKRHHLLEKDCALLTVQKLAKMHACSMLMAQENPKLMEPFQDAPIPKTNSDNRPCNQYFPTSIRLVAENVEQWPDHEGISMKISQLADNILDKADEMYESQTNAWLRVFNLCDIWIDNLMFKWHKDNNQAAIDDIVLLDFQLAYYGSPAMDLNYFLYGSLNETERKAYMKLLIREYHCTLTDTLIKLKYQEKIPTLKELTIDMITNSLQGVIAAFCLTPLIFTKNSEQFNDDEKLLLRSGIQNSKYQTFLQCTLEEFELNGFLDN